MKNQLWIIYGGLVALATALYYTVAHDSYWFNAIGISSPLLVMVAVEIHRPRHRIPWYLLALGQMLFIAGDVVAYNYNTFFGIALPYPSIADLLYLSVYPCLALTFLLMVRYRTPNRDWAGLLDSLMVTVSIGTVSWIFLIEPNWRASHAEFLTKLISVSYPIMDLLVLSVATRLAFGAGRRLPSLFLMLGASCALFITDSLYGWSLLHEPYVPGSGYLELGWIAFYMGFGMAALHPSMGPLTERAIEQNDRIGRKRLALLGAIALLPTSLRLVEYVLAEEIDNAILIGATFVLFVLVMLRMAGLIRLRERDALRERALREAGAVLVTATSRDSIRTAAIVAAQALAGSEAAVRVCERDANDATRYRVVAGNKAMEGSFSLPALEECTQLLNGEPCLLPPTHISLREALGLNPRQNLLFVTTLSPSEKLQELMLVVIGRNAPRGLGDALVALSSQVALALESAQLTETLLKQRSEARFTSLVKNASDVICVLEIDTSIRYITPSVEKVLGYGASELEGKLLIDLITLADQPRVLTILCARLDHEESTLLEFRAPHRDGSECFIEALRTNLMEDPNVRGIVLNMRDVSERKEFENQLSYQAFYDSVTGLANRALFRNHLQHAINRRKRDDRLIAILFIDLDDFKTINDSLGHAAGDQVLHEFGQRLCGSLRAADTAARFGGDEFAVLLESNNQSMQPNYVAERLLQALKEPFHLQGKHVLVHASIGIVVAHDKEEDIDTLLRNADVAMYFAKDQGKDQYQIYQPAMHDTLLRRLELKANLQVALDRGEFTLVYQPVVDLQTGMIVGAEALLRWRHAERGMISPLEFIPLAEETGQIIAIGQWVLQEACHYAVKLQRRVAQPLHMAVNLSARQLQDASLLGSIRQVLSDTGLAPSALILEITESVMMRDMDAAIARLHELKALGVYLAIDDFGTGYSSLNYIRRFPVDILKIDKSFVDGVSDKGQGLALTSALIDLADILKLRSVAEGIEHAEQCDRLRDMGCDLGQGYFFSAPLAPDDLERLIMHGLG